MSSRGIADSSRLSQHRSFEGRGDTVVLAAHGVVLHLVEICRFSIWHIFFYVDNDSVIMKYRYIIFVLVFGMCCECRFS